MDTNPHNQEGNNSWLSMSEAARLTPYSAEYLSLLARKKKLPAKKVGNVWYTNRETVEEYMRRQMLRTQIQNGGAPKNPQAPKTVQPPNVQPSQIPEVGVQAKQPEENISQPSAPAAFVPLVEPIFAKSTLQSELNPLNSPSRNIEHPEIKKLRTMKLDMEEYKAGKIPANQVYVDFIQRAGDQFFPKKPQPIIPSVRTVPQAEVKNKVEAIKTAAQPIKENEIKAPEPISIPVPEKHVLSAFPVQKPIPPQPIKIPTPIPETKHAPEAPKANPDLIAGIGLLLDQKLAPLSSQRKNVVTRSFQNVFSRTTLAITAILLALFFIIFPAPFVSAFFDGTAAALTNTFKNANTVLGFRPGTHANDILLLDKDGNISITGHIETDGQFQSYAQQGIAPIVVDSSTLVKNLNAEYLNGASTTDFTLAYVTKNGHITTDDVSLEGNVEVGKTLLVKGATHLLSSLEVDGSLSVLGDETISNSLTVSGVSRLTDVSAQNIGASTITANNITTGNITANGNAAIGANLSVRGGVDVGTGLTADSGAFHTLGVSNGFSAHGAIELGSSNEALTIDASNIQLDSDGNLSVSSVSTGSITTDSITASSSVFTNTIVAENSLTTNASTTNLLAENSTTTNATSTNFFSNIFSSIAANITSLVANSISVDALTATSTTAINATTTDATTTNLFVENSTAVNSTSTNFSAAESSTTNATTSSFAITGIENCNTTSALTTDATGNVVCGAIAGTGGGGGAVDSVTNSDGTLTVNPNTGVVVASINLNNSNVWTAASTTFAGGLTALTATTTSATTTNLAILGIAPSSLLKTNANGQVIAAVPGVDYSDFGQAWEITNGYLAPTTTIGILVSASSTVENLTSINSTSTNATTTNLFANTASSTNLSSTNASFGTLVTSTILSNGSSTLQNFTAVNSTSTNATSTSLFASIFHTVTGAVDTLTSISANITTLIANSISASALTTTNATTTNATTTNLVSFNAPLAPSYIATSTTASVFPYASTTEISSQTASTTNLLISGTPSSILSTDQTGAVGALTVGTGLTFSGNTLALNSVNNFGNTWNLITGGFNNYLTPTTTLGIGVFASSTIGDSTQTGGLTVNGGATTTGNAYIAGSLGIGTNSPDAQLTVTPTGGDWNEGISINPATDGYDAIFFRQSAGSIANSWFVGKEGTTNTLGILLNGLTGMVGTSRPDSAFEINTAGSAVFGGNVGINTAPSPNFNLQVNGTASITNLYTVNGTTTNATSTSFAITGISGSLLKTAADGAVVAATAGTDYDIFGNTWNLITGGFNNYLTPTTTVGIGVFASSTIGDSTEAGGLTVNGGATTTAIANFQSNVNINSPVSGSSFTFGSVATSSLFQVINNGSQYAVMIGNNNVDGSPPGVPTGATDSGGFNTPLQVYVPGDGGFQDTAGISVGSGQPGGGSTVGYNAFIRFNKRAFFGYEGTAPNGSAANVVLISGTKPISLSPDSGTTDALFVNTNDRVGIGSNDTAPAATLDVVSTTSVPLLDLDSFGGTSGGLFTVTNSGNVGINTASPNFRLEINGEASTTRFDASYATITNATTTNFFATTASTTKFSFATMIGGISTTTQATTTSLAITGIAGGSLLKTAADGAVVAATAGTDYDIFGNTWNLITGGFNNYLTPTTTVGIGVFASSTIGDSTEAGGLTVNGGATTTGNAYVAGVLNVVGGPSKFGSTPNAGAIVGTPTVFINPLNPDNTGAYTEALYLGSGVASGAGFYNSLISTGNERAYFGYEGTTISGAHPDDVVIGNASVKGTPVSTPIVMRTDSFADAGFYLSSTNRVGLGNDTNPAATLEAIATTSTPLLDLTAFGGTSGGLFTVTNSGNVGINTASPNFKLEINGEASTTRFDASYATTTNATSTSFFATTASSTNLFSTNLTTGLITSGLINGQTISSAASFTGTLTALGGLTNLSNLLVNGSSTLQNFTAINSTTTNATSTNLFAINGVFTSATSTNFFATNLKGTTLTANATFSGANLSSCALGDNALTWNNGQFGCNIISAFAIGGAGTFSTTTSSVSGEYINYPDNNTDIVTVGGNSTTTAKFYVDPNLSLAFVGVPLLVTSSSTLQNFTFANATGTNATTTNFFATTLSTTNLSLINLIAGNATSTNATSTNLFAAAFHTVTGAIDTLTSATANITTLVSNSISASALTVGSFNGPLQANAGVVSATTSVGVLYGGTGLTTAPAYGNILVGDGTGAYALTATSSLGLLSSQFEPWTLITGGFNNYLTPTTTVGIGVFASSTIGNGNQNGGLTINGGATTTGNLYVAGTGIIGTPGSQSNNASTSALTIYPVTPDNTGTYVPTLYISGGVDQGGASSGYNSLISVGGGRGFFGYEGTTRSGVDTFGEEVISDNPANPKNAVIRLDSINNAEALFSTNDRLALGSLGTGLPSVANATLEVISTTSTPLLDLTSWGGTSGGLFTVTNSGNVGINTASPNFKLEVNGEASTTRFDASYATSTNATSTSFAITGISGSLLKTAADGAVVAALPGTDYDIFGNTWNLITGGFNNYLTPTTTVGIGVFASSTIGDSTQAGGLTVNGGATTTATANFQSNVNINSPVGGSTFTFGSAATSSILQIQNNGTNASLVIGQNNVGGSGNALIGLTNQSGAINSLLNIIVPYDPGYVNPYGLSIDANPTGSSGSQNDFISFAKNRFLIGYEGTARNGAGTQAFTLSSNPANPKGVYFRLDSMNNVMANFTTGDRIAFGSLGTGAASSPTATLEVVGTTSVPYFSLTPYGGTSGSVFTVGSTGNVGINTASPNFKLEINGEASTTRFDASYATTTNATSTSFFATTASSTNSFTGGFNFRIATGTSATTTNFFTTTASSTNLFSTNLTTGLITSGLINGQTISSAANFTGTFTALGGLTNLSNLLLSGSSTLQNFTFVNATGTNATTTNFFTTTASSTNLFSSIATIGSNALVVNSNGKVGVGTNNPSATFQVNSGTGASSFQDIDIGGIGGWSSGEEHTINAVDGTGNVGSIMFDYNPATQGSISFGNLYNNGYTTDKLLTILANGNLGIGTTTPWAKLSVDSFNNGSQPQFIIASSTGSGATTTSLIINQFGNVGINTKTPNFTLEVSGTASTTNLFATNATSTSFAITGIAGGSLLKTAADGAVVAAAAGTDYQAPITAGTGLTFSGNTLNSAWTLSGSNLFNNSGTNVGINDTTPIDPLSVEGSPASGVLVLENTNVNGWSAVDVDSSTGAQEAGFGYGNASVPNFPGDGYFYTPGIDFVFGTNNSSGASVMIKSGGNVGIGQSAPSSKLSVNGNASVGASYSTIAAPTDGLIVKGNVGIGTSAPNFTLEVSGTASTTNFYSSYATTTNATSTNLFANLLNAVTASTTNIFASGSTTLQKFTFTNATGTQATTTNFAITSISSSLLKTAADGAVVAAVPGTDYDIFGNTWNLITGGFNNYLTPTTTVGIGVFASSTIGNGNQNGGLTIFGGATTTGNAYFAGNVGVGTTSPFASLSIGGSGFFDGSITSYGTDTAPIFVATSTTATSTFAGGFDVNSGSLRYDYSSGITNIDNLQIGQTDFDTDAGVVTWTDMPVTSNSTLGTVESYSANLNGSPELTVYGLSGGNGLVTNTAVGIGTTSPYAKFSIYASTSTDPSTLFAVGSTTAAGAISTFMSILNTGNVGIGTTNPQAALDVQGTASSTHFFAQASSTLQTFTFTNATGTNATTTNFFTTTASSTNLFSTSFITGIATTTNATSTSLFATNIIGTKVTAGTLVLGSPRGCGDNSSSALATDDSGNIYCLGGLSDERLKTDISTTTDALTSIDALTPVSFYWKDNTIQGTESTQQQFGFLAQELVQVFPNLVSMTTPTKLTPNGTYEIDYTGLISPLVAAVQEIDAKVDAQNASTTAQIGTLTAEVAALQGIVMENNIDNSISTSTVTSIVSNWFGTFGANIENNVAHFTQLAIDSLTVTTEYANNIIADSVSTKALTIGSAEYHSGITLYDQMNGSPYCIQIINGVMESLPGACANAATSTPTDTIGDNDLGNSDTSSGSDASSTSSTTNGTTTSDDTNTSTSTDSSTNNASSTPDDGSISGTGTTTDTVIEGTGTTTPDSGTVTTGDDASSTPNEDTSDATVTSGSGNSDASSSDADSGSDTDSSVSGGSTSDASSTTP